MGDVLSIYDGNTPVCQCCGASLKDDWSTQFCDDGRCCGDLINCTGCGARLSDYERGPVCDCCMNVAA